MVTIFTDTEEGGLWDGLIDPKPVTLHQVFRGLISSSQKIRIFAGKLVKKGKRKQLIPDVFQAGELGLMLELLDQVDRGKFRFIASSSDRNAPGREESPWIEKDPRAIEAALNSIDLICQAGGIKIAGCECGHGDQYRIEFQREGAMPCIALEWEHESFSSIGHQFLILHCGDETTKAVVDLCFFSGISTEVAFATNRDRPRIHVDHHFGNCGGVTALTFEDTPISGFFSLKDYSDTESGLIAANASVKALGEALECLEDDYEAEATAAGYNIKNDVSGVAYNAAGEMLQIARDGLEYAPALDGLLRLKCPLRDLSLLCGKGSANIRLTIFRAQCEMKTETIEAIHCSTAKVKIPNFRANDC